MKDFVLKGRRMSGSKVAEAMAFLGVDDAELAAELQVSERTVYRWRKGGVSGAPTRAIQAFTRLHRAHLPWKRGAVSIYLTLDPSPEPVQ